MTDVTTLPTARDLAATILVRVLRDDAWIAPTLTTELDRYPQLDARERALTTELIYGTVRAYHWLARELGKRTKQGGIEDEVALAHMLIAAYQVLLLDRVPAHAAIDAAVGAIRRDRDPKLAGFANAVLRRLSREAAQVDRTHVARDSVPRWLRERTEKSLGKEAARAFFAERQGAPPVALRVRDVRDTSVWVDRLRELAHGATFDECDLPGCIIARDAGRLESLEGFGEAWVPQDYGSQHIAHALGARPGDRVLDACAGRGHKTAILSQSAGPMGRVDAADIAPKKLALHGSGGLGGGAVRTFAVDWLRGIGDAAPEYDRILVDAPCSGTGTIGRRPEILLRLRDADLGTLRATQLGIATRVASLLAPGGTLVYSVCSVLREEGEKIVDELVADTGLVPVPDAARRILPPAQPSDGYFFATLQRVRS